MKYCKNCGAENSDNNIFCFNCRCESFNPAQPAPPYPNANVPVLPAAQPVYMTPAKPKEALGISELLTVLGFVCAVVGMYRISMILHPIGVLTSIIGFVKGKRYRGLALAGTVISAVGGIIYLVISLYKNGMLPEWITYGAFH